MYSTFFTQINKKMPVLFLLLSLLAQPLQAHAQHCNCEEVNTCQDSCHIKSALIIGGAAVVGGIVGVVASRSNHHHHHSGSCSCPSGSPGPAGPVGPAGPAGPTGPPGPGFNADVGQSLTFNLLFIPGIESPFTGTVIPFVTGPDGVTTAGVPITDTFILETSFEPIIITNPAFGQYQAGVQITLSDNSSFFVEIGGTVYASRDESLTRLTSVSFSSSPTTPVQLSNLLFSYDPFNVP